MEFKWFHFYGIHGLNRYYYSWDISLLLRHYIQIYKYLVSMVAMVAMVSFVQVTLIITIWIIKVPMEALEIYKNERYQ